LIPKFDTDMPFSPHELAPTDDRTFPASGVVFTLVFMEGDDELAVDAGFGDPFVGVEFGEEEEEEDGGMGARTRGGSKGGQIPIQAGEEGGDVRRVFSEN
jgi:hypothetical protein